MEVSERLAEGGLGLDVAPALIKPVAQLVRDGRAVAQAPLEALLEALTQTLGLGVDVEDLGVELEAFDGAGVATPERIDQTAPAVRVASASATAREPST